MLEWLHSIRDARKHVPEAAPEPQDLSGRALLLSGATMLTHDALGGRTWCVVKFPFLIGRPSTRTKGRPCDLYLADQEPFQVSRNHCQIVWVPSREGFFVQDSDSKLGTLVNGFRIGTGGSKTMAPLRKGVNAIVLGSEQSQFGFEVRLPKALG